MIRKSIEIIGRPAGVSPIVGTKFSRLDTRMLVKVGDYLLVVPKGLTTDGTTIPPPFNWLWSRWHETYVYAAFVHDFLYQETGTITVSSMHNGTDEPMEVTRLEADLLFHVLCLREGCTKTKAILFYLAVRLFGYYTWYSRAAKQLAKHQDTEHEYNRR